MMLIGIVGAASEHGLPSLRHRDRDEIAERAGARTAVAHYDRHVTTLHAGRNLKGDLIESDTTPGPAGINHVRRLRSHEYRDSGEVRESRRHNVVRPWNRTKARGPCRDGLSAPGGSCERLRGAIRPRENPWP